MDDDDAVGMALAEGFDVSGPEALVDRAVPLPEQEGGGLDVHLLQTAGALPGIPDLHVGCGVTELVAGVASEMLVREKEHLGPRPVAERPGEHGPGVGRRAD